MTHHRPPHRVSAHLRFCRFGDRFVCLDLAASRYVLLEGRIAEDFSAFTGDGAPDEAIGRLAALGLIEIGEPFAPSPGACTPTTSLLDHPLRRPSPWLLCRALAAQRRARRDLARKSLVALLAPTGLPAADSESCRAIACAFARASRYRDATDQCLVRTLAMRSMMARRGLGVDLVIGVTLPFAAHCWVQAGAVVLSDPFDHVRNFQPLLTVR